MGLTNTLPKQVMELKQQNNFTVNKKKHIYQKNVVILRHSRRTSRYKYFR